MQGSPLAGRPCFCSETKPKINHVAKRKSLIFKKNNGVVCASLHRYKKIKQSHMKLLYFR